jgi:hypothetical protein
MILTGADGQLKYGSQGIAKVRNWSLSIQRNAIDVTCLEEFDRSYVAGIRNTTGSATIYYDPTQSDDVKLLNSVLQDRDCNSGPCTENVTFVLNRCGSQGQFNCDCLITEVGPAVNVGEATSVNVSFQVTGPLDGAF